LKKGEFKRALSTQELFLWGQSSKKKSVQEKKFDLRREKRVKTRRTMTTTTTTTTTTCLR
jgi:hypothetical protein